MIRHTDTNETFATVAEALGAAVAAMVSRYNSARLSITVYDDAANGKDLYEVVGHTLGRISVVNLF